MFMCFIAGNEGILDKPILLLRNANAPMVQAASHVDHEKKLHGFLFLYMHACGSVSIVMVLRLAALRAAGAPL